MFDIPDLQQSIIKGMQRDPSIISILRTVKNNRKRIEQRVLSTDRRIGSNHILVRLLGALQLNRNMTYEEVEWLCRRNLSRVSNSVGATCPNNYGKPFVGEFMPKQDEIISIVARPINSDINWRKCSPVRYLYHPHTNIDWEINTAEAYGLAFIEINIVELAWSYISALRYYAAREESHNLYVWIYRYAVYSAMPSYFNISVFNRHYFFVSGKQIKKDVTNRIYAVPDITSQLDKHVETVSGYLRAGSPLPATCLNHVMLLMPDNKLDYFTGIVLPVSTEYNWQQRWVYELVNMHFMLFALEYYNDSMAKFIPRIRRELIAFKQLRIIPKMPSHLQVHINRELINKLETALQ